MAQWQDLNAGADLDAAGARGDRTGDGQRRAQNRAARLLVDFGEPDGIEPPAVRRFDLSQRLRECRRRGLIRPAVELMVDADLHRPLLVLLGTLGDGNFDFFIKQMPIADPRNAAPAWQGSDKFLPRPS